MPPPDSDQQRLVGNQKDFIHAIHGAAERSNNFTWHEESATDGFWKTTYPGVLNDCQMCHLPGTYDFSSTTTTSAYPNMLASTVGQGTYATGSVHAPFVTEGTNYGVGFSYNALTGATTNADPTTLVDLAVRRGLRLLPRLVDRDRPHADQRRSRSTIRAARRSPSRSRRSACSATAPAPSPRSPTLHAFTP